MKLTWDEGKREKTLRERRLDFDHCVSVFAGPTLTFEDTRKDYGESRFQTVGFLDGKMVVVVHTDRDDTKRIISMRYANEREKERYEIKVG